MAEETTQKNTQQDAREKNRRTKNRRRGRKPVRREQEVKHTVVDIRRVARTVAGGRRFSFSATVIAGDRKGGVGVGVGKAGDTALAITKAVRSAQKNMIWVKRTEDGSIPHEVKAKYASAVVVLFPVSGMTGVTAGGAVRTVLEYGGIRGVTAKIRSRSKNTINNARATLKALLELPGTVQKPYREKQVTDVPRKREARSRTK